MGVLIIAITKMFDDMIIFMLIELVMVVGFACAFQALYPDSQDEFMLFGNAFYFTFFATFGEYDISVLESADTFQTMTGCEHYNCFSLCRLRSSACHLLNIPVTNTLSSCRYILCWVPVHAGHHSHQPADRNDVAHLR